MRPYGSKTSSNTQLVQQSLENRETEDFTAGPKTSGDAPQLTLLFNVKSQMIHKIYVDVSFWGQAELKRSTTVPLYGALTQMRSWCEERGVRRWRRDKGSRGWIDRSWRRKRCHKRKKKRSVKSSKTAVMHNKSQTTKPGGGRANLESNL